MSEKLYNLNEGWNSLAGELLYACMDQYSNDELAFYEQRIRANGGTALDQACGTGRHLFKLIQRGLNVHGADVSADALRFARIKAKGMKVHPEFYHQRMEDFEVPHRYGTIYIANGTFVVISAKAQHWGPTKCASGKGEISTKLWTESFDLLEQTMVEKRRYELHVDGQLARSELHTLHTRWYYKYEFIMMLEKAGFEDIYLYSDYTEEPASKESKTIVYGARNLST